MILWTILPIEMVCSYEYIPDYHEIEYMGIKILAERISPTQCKIARILTTNPQDYLRTDIQPGVIINYKPVFEHSLS